MGHNPFRCTPGMILAMLAGSSAGHQTWPVGVRGSSEATGKCLKLKFIWCPVDFHNQPHILHTSFRYRPISGPESSSNRPLSVTSEETFWDWTWVDIRSMSVYTLESNPPMSDRLEPVWTRYVTNIGWSLAGYNWASAGLYKNPVSRRVQHYSHTR